MPGSDYNYKSLRTATKLRLLLSGFKKATSQLSFSFHMERQENSHLYNAFTNARCDGIWTMTSGQMYLIITCKCFFSHSAFQVVSFKKKSFYKWAMRVSK